jgi:hypothetical protein
MAWTCVRAVVNITSELHEQKLALFLPLLNETHLQSNADAVINYKLKKNRTHNDKMAKRFYLNLKAKT